MIGWFSKRRNGPIGLDLGSRSVKLVQFSADSTRIIDAARWDLPTEMPASPEARRSTLAQAVREAWQSRGFKGREAVVCVSDRELFIQNLRVPKAQGPELQRSVQQEAAGRVPFPIAETEFDFLEAADIRQGDQTLREIILLACHRPVLDQMLDVVVAAGLRPAAVDVEPLALLRNFIRQSRREEDHKVRSLFVHVGHVKTAIVIAQGDEVLFLKYVDLGGRHFDEAVARHLGQDLAAAVALRRTNGDRRSDQQDPEIARSVADAVRPLTEKLVSELSLCVRYHSVTFRGHPLVRLVLGGGEATPQLLETVSKRLDLKCELSDPFRSFASAPQTNRKGQWDVAAGLAYRTLA